ncbi:cupredoxin domain-containing protein [Roseobacter sp. S98]|uniref:cupredoxin domain-containing protein n=1 Tax=Roseobacter algicola (ex Choi et al. 2025) (nom. illeg.) TaxID=3092138 RepID=UPI0035C6838E
MRRVNPFSRRLFWQGLGASLALVTTRRAVSAHEGTHVVDVKVSGFEFAPAAVEIIAGDTVVWVNHDIAPHTATAVEGDWDTGTLEKGEEARIIFKEPGLHRYFCAYHPHMTGEIRVLSKPGG